MPASHFKLRPSAAAQSPSVVQPVHSAAGMVPLPAQAAPSAATHVWSAGLQVQPVVVQSASEMHSTHTTWPSTLRQAG